MPATCGWAGQDACGFPGRRLPGLPPQGGAEGLHGSRAAFGLRTFTHLLPWGSGGSEGHAQLCLRQGQGPELGHPPSPTKECTGLMSILKGLQTQQPFLFLYFIFYFFLFFGHVPLLSYGPVLRAALCFWGSRMRVAATSWPEREGVGQVVSVSPAEPAATPAQPTPPQEQGGLDPEDAGIRAHDPIPGVLGGSAALRSPQPAGKCEQQRDACPQWAEA